MLIDLLDRGFFPKELPRPFQTSSYANAIRTQTVPNAWNSPRPGQPASYSLARFGVFRRPLAICNPVHFYGLSAELANSWGKIAPLVAGTNLSATSPTQSQNGRAFKGRIALGEKPQRSIECRVGRRYVLQTDISRFYSSIYTHSIPWAIHSKALAKANKKNNALLGNRIDFWVRQGQSQQTVGIPIGPDTSLVLAELLMQRCDERLLASLPGLKGHRFIDDYELCFRSRTEAEDAYHLLESCLSEFGLALNPKKTTIRELPIELESEWSIALKRFSIRASGAGVPHDLESYFGLAFSLHRRHPDESVLQYAIARLRSLDVPPLYWSKLQQLLLLCVEPEPACFPYAIDLIITRKNSGAAILKQEITETIDNLLLEHAPLNHSSEVANAIWAAIALRLRISAKAMKAVSRCDDPVVALLALDYKECGLYRATLDTDVWQSYMTAEELYGDRWLLAYEARIKGWLPSNDTNDYVANDPCFSFLTNAGVSFYDTQVTRQRKGMTPRPRLPTPVNRY